MSYMVFVAEDEPRVREGIRAQLELSGQYQLCGEAADGEMALPAMLELKPDILITDIKMPFMDGIGLSRAVKRALPRTKVLIISGYDEFEFAKQAISIGVDEYLLKPVSAKALLEALDKIAAQLEEERGLAAWRGGAVPGRQEEMYRREQFLDKLLAGALDTAGVLDEAERVGLSLVAKLYMAAEMELRYEHAEPGAALSLRDAVDALLAARDDVLWCLRGSDRIVLIVKGDSPGSVEEAMYEVVLAVRDELARALTITSATFIGMPVERITAIPASYNAAHALLRHFPNPPEGSVINHGDFEHDYLQYLATSVEEPVARLLRYAGESDIERILDAAFGPAGHEAGSSLYAYHRFADLLFAAARMVNEAGGNAAEVFPELTQPGLLERMGGPDEMRKGAREMLRRFVAYRQNASGSLKYGDALARAKEYICENYADPGMSLNTVAGIIGFSPNHFSTIFSQNTGETFIGFLTRVRMERARELLLATDFATAEVADLTGYTDSNYFRYLFKKSTGKSPREFRSDKGG